MHFVYTTQHIESKMVMIDLTVVLSAKDVASVSELRILLAKHVNLSRQELGCLRFEALESQSVPGTFFLFERWESQASLDVHRAAEAITTVYRPKVLPLVERVVHVCDVLM